MSSRSIAELRERAQRIVKILDAEYPDARCTLDFDTPHQLLAAAILAAQCTDERVNQTTPALFARYTDVTAFAEADPAELEEIVRPTGFFRNKTKALIQSAREIVEHHGGVVPDTIDELVELSGVGRKTANLLVGDAFGKPAVIVDTHVKRVSARLGLTDHKDPDKIEIDLRAILAEEDSTRFNHLIVAHGRAVCKARSPRCVGCALLELCPYGLQHTAGKLL